MPSWATSVKEDVAVWNTVALGGYWVALWATDRAFYSLEEFEGRLRKDDFVVRLFASLIGALVVQLVLRGMVSPLFRRSPTAESQFDINDIMRTVTPVIVFNTLTCPWTIGSEPFDAVVWAYWFTFCACISGVNVICRQLRSNTPEQPEAMRVGSVSVPVDVALMMLVLVVNLGGLGCLFWHAGVLALTPMVWIKWGHESLKELVTTVVLLSKEYLRSRQDGYVMGRSVIEIEFDVDSWGKIVWRVLHLLSSGYLLWVDGFATIAIDIMVYFRLRASWRILGVEISKRLSRADVTTQIDQLYPQTTVMDKDDSQCPICWEEMPVASVLPCKHRFHRDCLRDWVKDQGSCPTCRHPINMVASSNTQGRDDIWHQALRRLFSLGGPTPQEIEQMTQQLHRVFPNVAVAAIEHDLVLTGSVEVTADRLTREQVY